LFKNERNENQPEAPRAPIRGGGGFRWRPWPCPSCNGGLTPADFLFRSFPAGSSFQQKPDSPEEIAAAQSKALLRWISRCPHSDWTTVDHPFLAEGSEHLVYLEERSGLVWKLTRPGVFGDTYFLVDGIVHQRNSSPLDYLDRLRLWQIVFGVAPIAAGLTDLGQIVSSDSFVPGNPPTQQNVDQFLIAAGLVPVKQNCWLWKKSFPDLEIWVGDARADNFVESPAGMVPIDLRLWITPPET
jgi:hypothetical protein